MRQLQQVKNIRVTENEIITCTLLSREPKSSHKKTSNDHERSQKEICLWNGSLVAHFNNYLMRS